MLKEKIAPIERQMLARLEEIRATHVNSGIKGTIAERTVADFLQKYLPLKYQIGNGEVVDQDNNTSRQTDVVIVNENHPFTFSPNEPGLVFIEGVVAAGEIKSVLGKKEIGDVIQKSITFKKLRPKYIKGCQRWGKESDFPRFSDRRAFFAFAYESNLSNETILELLREAKEKAGQTNEYILDAICVLNRGFIVDLSDGNGYYQIRSNKTDLPFTEWVIGFTENMLFHLLAWLNSVVPQEFRPRLILPEYFMRM